MTAPALCHFFGRLAHSAAERTLTSKSFNAARVWSLGKPDTAAP